ncbi:glutaminyl-peptide cyclotransferase [Dehalogenimonas etheniformans]|uniref:Glutaminyl-peptide cyclotransferase n=2 Tax=Dehalogenimonas etheniformans TaxID=1536648 RepID=A0A2P5P9T2_9CHLR|nr:glutaminyl-peptide cyclotransferase [Dehalogenimonas etheniformans]QNT77168.1 glutaminyl-peptide cyclotransferase [Dehalogenimonas etheniformans]
MVAAAFVATLLFSLLSCGTAPTTSTTAPQTTTPPVAEYTYRIVNTYPHDRGAFTEGLIYSDGFLYESTGLYGQSTLRKVELATGRALQNASLDSKYFGEGLTVWQDSLVQLTWQTHIGFVSSKDTFSVLKSFSYATEGWGLTQDGTRLIMSDGTSTIYFLDPATFQVSGKIEVKDKGTPVVNINELEYVNGKIYANIWMTDKIAVINPGTGNVESWIDLTGLLPPFSNPVAVDVLNGIAYDAAGKRLFVTGKLWPLLFEIELVPKA